MINTFNPAIARLAGFYFGKINSLDLLIIRVCDYSGLRKIDKGEWNNSRN